MKLDRFFLEILKNQISRKTVQWEPSCSMRTDGRTDMTKLIVAFRNFMKASKNQSVNHQSVKLTNRQTQPYISNVLFFLIQQDYMFRLFTSAIIR